MNEDELKKLIKNSINKEEDNWTSSIAKDDVLKTISMEIDISKIVITPPLLDEESSRIAPIKKNKYLWMYLLSGLIFIAAISLLIIKFS